MTKDSSDATLKIDNSILGQGDTTVKDVEGTAEKSGSNNFIRTQNVLGTGTFDKTTTLDPLLGTLADNGGGIRTHLPSENSPVIDAGDNSLATLLTADQRHYEPRVFNSIIDIGSVELNAVDPFPVLTPPTVAQTTSEGSETSFNLGSLADLYTSGDYTITVNWGDGSSNSTFTMTAPGTLPSLTHTYVNDDTFIITVSAVESDGAATNQSNEIQFDVVVNNVLPTITLVANQTATTNQSSAINVGSFADPGPADSPWQVSIDFGDGSDLVAFDQDTAGVIPFQSHTYGKEGTYTVTVKVSDDRGTTTSTSEVVVGDKFDSKIVVGGPTTVKTFNVDGTLNNEITPFGNDYTGTVRVVEGDVNGDGTPDLIVSTGPGVQNLVRIIDGQSREVVEEFSRSKPPSPAVSSWPSATSTAMVTAKSSPRPTMAVDRASAFTTG
ncbi:MAG: PKD domain-containing protein [Gemmataceae bacterium]